MKELAEAKLWYGELLGKEPELEPAPGIVEFKVGETWLQLVEGRSRGTDWVFRIGVPDVTAEQRRLNELGIETGEIATIPRVISWFDFDDPDGNRLSFYEMLTASTSPKKRNDGTPKLRT